MAEFMGRDFLLQNETARMLYHGCAEQLPVLDYHCHLSPKEIAQNRRFTSITQLWLDGDHYKWRLMRACGVPEELITGNADDRERFLAYASILPKLAGNPIYHWSHLELRTYFGVMQPLCRENAHAVYDACHVYLQQNAVTPQSLIRNSRVQALCTTDDPCDTLEYHAQVAEDSAMGFRVLPAFRPDQALAVQKPGFADYIQLLSDAAEMAVQNPADVAQALIKRMDHFEKQGCRCADHGLDQCVCMPLDMAQVQAAFTTAVRGGVPTPQQAQAYQTYLLVRLAREYQKRDWVMQLHFGCQRNVNTRMFSTYGADIGCDAIHPCSGVEHLAPLLDTIQRHVDALPKLIVYSLDPNDNAAIDTILGCFDTGSLQHGAAWWFNDTCDGITAHLKGLAARGVLGNFVGMLTDSRSFLSYARHGYFRRILCNLVGAWAETGAYTSELPALRTLIEQICYRNAQSYFGLE